MPRLINAYDVWRGHCRQPPGSLHRRGPSAGPADDGRDEPEAVRVLGAQRIPVIARLGCLAQAEHPRPERRDCRRRARGRRGRNTTINGVPVAASRMSQASARLRRRGGGAVQRRDHRFRQALIARIIGV